MEIRDSLALDASGLRVTKDGYVVGDAKVSRAGNVQTYLGYELGLTDDRASKSFGVYRDPSVVFDEESMMSLAGRPVTRGHPSDPVTSDNWKTLAVGHVGGRIARDGEHVVAPMAIMDAQAVKEIQAGARSLSAGYTVGIVEDAGQTEDGTPYSFRQVGPLRFNHVAYLPDNNPRAGNTRIGDSSGNRGEGRSIWGAAPLSTHDTEENRSMTDVRKVLVDGLQVETTDAGAAAITKLQKDKDAADQKLADAKSQHDAAMTAKDAAHAEALAKKDEEIGTLKADKKKLEDAAMTPEKVTKLVADRVALETTAKAIFADVQTANVTDADLRRAVVDHKYADDFKDAPDAEISGVFKALAKDAAASAADQSDPVRNAIRDRQPAQTGDANAAWEKNSERLRNAWKGTNAA